MGQSRLRKAASSKPGLLDEITTVGTRCSLCQQHAIGPRLIPRRTFKGALSIQAVSCCHRMGGSIWCRTPRSDKQIQTVVALVTSVWCQVREPYAPALSSASHPDPCIVRTGIKRWTAAWPYPIQPNRRKRLQHARRLTTIQGILHKKNRPPGRERPIRSPNNGDSDQGTAIT